MITARFECSQQRAGTSEWVPSPACVCQSSQVRTIFVVSSYFF